MSFCTGNAVDATDATPMLTVCCRVWLSAAELLQRVGSTHSKYRNHHEQTKHHDAMR
jgi:hypothetical protein